MKTRHRPASPNLPLAKGVPGSEMPTLGRIYVYLTDGCNLACRHCWLTPRFDPAGQAATMLPIAAFEHVVRQAMPLGLHAVKFTGGEPLLHPQFEDLVEIVRRAGLRLDIETNGVLLTPERAIRVAQCESGAVAVSLDGADASTHEAVRGVAGSFRAALEGVRALVEAGIRPQIIMSVMRQNVERLDEVVRLAERLGASSVKFNVVQPVGRGSQLQASGALLGVPELIELGRHVDMDLSSKTRLPLFFDIPPAFRPLSRISRGNGCETCKILGILGLLPTAEYALCGIGKHIPELVFGSVERDSLQGVWNESTVLRSLREGMPDKLVGVCSRCLMKEMCLGSCVADNYARAGSLWDPFWLCDQAEQLGLFPPSRLALDSTVSEAGAAHAPFFKKGEGHERGNG